MSQHVKTVENSLLRIGAGGHDPLYMGLVAYTTIHYSLTQTWQFSVPNTQSKYIYLTCDSEVPRENNFFKEPSFEMKSKQLWYLSGCPIRHLSFSWLCLSKHLPWLHKYRYNQVN